MTSGKRGRTGKLRLVFFSHEDTDCRILEFNIQKLILWSGVGLSMGIGLIIVCVALMNSLFQNSTNNSLLHTNNFLKNKIKSLQTDVQHLDVKLRDLEEDTDDLEVLVGLTESGGDSIASVSKQPFVMAAMPVDHAYSSDRLTEYLNTLESRIDNAVQLQDVIEEQFLHTRSEIKHIPSVRPVRGARITDRFGHRKDPFVERVKHHNGIDLSAPYGTRVFAAAAGYVEFTRVRYKLNKGYGRVIIINHDNGYKTLYGHLSRILVKPKQRVDRWEVIGLSGDTGRATGPHLHYEVWFEGRPQNPEDFILD
jgi:septal ring factor EnvC (AmiA/AmiB activator)